MFRLLIVDDEPIILDGLYSFFQKSDIEDLEIFKAYSAFEAVEWMNTVRIDLVLSDISMPAMSGMQLIQEIVDRWPRCKIILLTGFDEFEYAHQAIRNPCVVDYLLKTEGMGRIGEAVKKALDQLVEENQYRYQAEWLREKLPRALLQLQRQVLAEVCRSSDGCERPTLQDEFDALRLPFQARRPALPVVIRVEAWNHYATDSDRSLIRYAVANIAEELLQDRAEVKAFDLDRQTIACLIQPKADDYGLYPAEAVWERTLRFVHGTLETVQQACGAALQLSVSVVSAESAAPWSMLGAALNKLRLAIVGTPGFGMEKLLRIAIGSDPESGAADGHPGAAPDILLEQLKQHLLQGGEEWGYAFRKWVNRMGATGPEDPYLRLRAQQGLNLCLMDALRELKHAAADSAGADLSRMLHFDIRTPWADLISFYQTAFEHLAASRNQSHQNEESEMLRRIHRFIHEHLEHDLSLTRIAQEVSLNPSYLSRWYKRVAGKGLSEYITETRVESGKELLLGTGLKMEQISAKLGFSDPHYFYRFFKKAVGCTPQEYRDSSKNPAGK